MSDWNEINNAFTERLNDNWTETPIAYDNIYYNPTPHTEWVRAYTRPATTINNELGTSVIHFGIFWIEVNCPLSQGSGRAYELCSLLEPLFSNVQFGDIVCYAAQTTRTGENKGWYQLELRADFWVHDRG